MKKASKAVNKFFVNLDSWHLEALGILVLAILAAPILYLKKGAVFPIHDQLDELILNYVLSAKYFGQSMIPNMMNGLPASALKPSAYIFLPLYALLSPFAAFVIQYICVITTAFYGNYGAVKKLTGSSIAAFLSASLFAMLPFRSIYGNCLSGVPLLVFSFLLLSGEKSGTFKKIAAYVLIVYVALSSNLVLTGFPAITFLLIWMAVLAIKKKKFPVHFFFFGLTLVLSYLICNLDLVKEALGMGENFVSHRVEADIGLTGRSFFSHFKDVFFEGVQMSESWHKYIFVAVVVALPFVIGIGAKTKALRHAFAWMALATFAATVLTAFFSTDGFILFRSRLPGMFSSFQFQRFFYLLPGLWFMLLGICLGLVIKGLSDHAAPAGVLIALAALLPSVNYIARNPESIFYQNVNQVNNGAITGYITWEKLYAEDLMEEIGKDIASSCGLSKEDYRVGCIGICPVVPLMNGFYTIDGYSNNYDVEYKHAFAKAEEEELAKNEYNAAYFYDWGNRCYLFSHEWGNAYMIGKDEHVYLDDFCFDTDALKDLHCRYLLTAGEVHDAKAHGLTERGYYESPGSYWGIWVYELD